MLGRISFTLIALSVAGCRSGPAYMREVDPMRQLQAPADRALVVFVRSSTDASETPVHVMDDKSVFLGTAMPGGHFSIVRPTGKQQFIAFTGDLADALIADLAPGLVYFVELEPHPGKGLVRFVFRASARGTKLFPFKTEWIEDTTQFRVDQQVAREQMGPVAEKRREKVVKDANERLRKYAGIELTEHTLAQTDGHAKVGIPGTVRYAAPAPAVVPIPLQVATPVRPAPVPIATPTPAPAPAPVTPGFTPEDFPSPPPPGPPPELVHNPPGIKKGLKKGTVVRVTLKNGTTWLGEVVRETRVDLKISVGGAMHLLDFEDMTSIEELRK